MRVTLIALFAAGFFFAGHAFAASGERRPAERAAPGEISPPEPRPLHPVGDNSCEHAFDGKCDEPTDCRTGTDKNDCQGSEAQ